MINFLKMIKLEWILLLSLVFAIYYQSTKIESLESTNEILERQKSELELNIDHLELKNKNQKIAFDKQIKSLSEISEKRVADLIKVNDKILKDSKRDHDNIYKKKLNFVESELNKHIEINIDKFNKGE